MPISEHMSALRVKVGHDLLMMPSAAGIVRDAQGWVLLQRRADNGLWSVPGGALDPDEQPAQACIREVYEETGLVVRPVQVLSVETHPVTSYPNGDVAQAIVTVFECVVIGGELGGLDGESLELRFFAPDSLPASSFVQRFLPEVFEDGRVSAAFAWDASWLPTDSVPDAGSIATT
ncbi:MAG: NUDIX domain-containing protein [Actinomycetota bacterium]|nr:NUDIX domain-containing protein [Actinomycetota bacterium]